MFTAHFVTPPTQASTPVFAAATGMPSQPQIRGGELGEDKSFYFRGPDGALNLQAQNLAFFLQIAEGIDDQTWLRHLRAGDYSQWLRDKIRRRTRRRCRKRRKKPGVDAVRKPAPDQRKPSSAAYTSPA